MLLPGHALPIPYSPAYWLEFVKAILDHVEEGNVLRTESNIREGAWAPEARLLCHFSQICFHTGRCLETTELNILF